MEKNANNLLHQSFVANDAVFGTFALSDVILVGLPMYRYFQQILFLFHQPSVEAISSVQKVRIIFQDLIETDSHKCGTMICLCMHSEKTTCLSNLHRLSIKINILIGREQNEITPTGHFMANPGASD